LQGLGEFRLGWVRSTVGKICFVFDFIHTAYTVYACALTSILPSLSLIDMIHFTVDTKVTPSSVQGVGVDFYILISVLYNVVKRVRNSTARFHCVFGSKDVFQRSTHTAHTFRHLNYMKPFCILPYPRMSFARSG